MVRISAIVCTHNRAVFLSQALESLRNQTLSEDQYEVIVVDNACTDRTSEVLRSLAAVTPNLRYIREERLGLSWARNAGAGLSSAPYVAYLDDDAWAEPSWLENILRVFEEVCPSPAAVGGRVWLDWNGTSPSWLPRKYWSLYTYTDHGEEGFFVEGEYLVGANIAFRKDVLIKMGGFDTHLGRKGTSLLSGEEAALLQELREKHFPIYYTPEAIVWHAVLKVRQRRRWLWKRMFCDGASQPFLDYGKGRSRRFYVLVAYHDLRRLALFASKWLEALVDRNREGRLANSFALVQRLGRLCTTLWLSTRGCM